MSYFIQEQAFIRSTEQRERKKVIGRTIACAEQTTTSPNVLAILRDLQQRETERPGSVLAQIGTGQGTVVFTLRDRIAELYGRTGLN